MKRSCLLCVGSIDSIKTLMDSRINSHKGDYMSYLFSIPIKDNICVSAVRLTPVVSHCLPPGEVLHPGYCGEECLDLLMEAGFSNKFVICGLESPNCNCDFTTYDIVFPQGKCERDEHPRDAAIREFSEETGIPLSIYTYITFLGVVGKYKEMSVYVLVLD